MNLAEQRVLVVGASRGLGAAVAERLAGRVSRLWTASRTPARRGVWVRADVTETTGRDAVVRAIGDDALDALLFLGGTWEEGAFTSTYRFATSPAEETERVIAMNLVAPILMVQACLPALRRALRPKCVFVGARSGRDHCATREVANSASKYGLRGAAQALALELPELAFTVVNPGNVATEEVEQDIAAGRFAAQSPIPLADFVACIEFVLGRESAVISEIDLEQRRAAAPS